MHNHYFSKQDAKSLIGHSVRTRVSYSELPPDTIGTVKWIDEVALGSYAIVIQWSLPGQVQQALLWFSKRQFQQYLRET